MRVCVCAYISPRLQYLFIYGFYCFKIDFSFARLLLVNDELSEYQYENIELFNEEKSISIDRWPCRTNIERHISNRFDRVQ
jgi:hypothetical protein